MKTKINNCKMGFIDSFKVSLFCLLIEYSLISCSLSLDLYSSCDHDGFYSDSKNCALFYFCKDGSRYHLSCGKGTLFDPLTGKCRLISADECKPGQTVYFSHSLTSMNHMVYKPHLTKKPKLVCYVQNWDLCISQKLREKNRVVCDKTCEAFGFSDDIDIRAAPPCDTSKPHNPTIKPTQVVRPTDKYKIVCYVLQEAWFRKGQGKFIPEQVDPTICTHLVYHKLILDAKTLTAKIQNTWTDVDNGLFSKMLKHKEKGVKVMVLMGGWYDSEGDKYSRMVNNEQSRKNFVSSLVALLEQWGFDGIELDWQYPKCWQQDCTTGPDSDNVNFLNLMKELRAAFDRKGLVLGTVLSRYTFVVDNTYDAKAVSEYVDWITVHTYNYYRAQQGVTGHNAPLYDYSGEHLNINFSMNYILNRGVPANKLLVSTVTYGNSYTLTDPESHDIMSLVNGQGQLGEFTETSDFLAFYEVCNYVKKKGWSVAFDPEGRYGHYAYKGDQWSSYDDISDMKRKAKYIKDNGFGGANVWSMCEDDFRNICGCGRYPLIKALNQELFGTFSDIKLENCT